VLVRDRAFFISRSSAVRFAYLAAAFALAWQWIASLSLSGIYLFGARPWALSGWRWPFLATFALPVFIFALIFLDAYQRGQKARV